MIKSREYLKKGIPNIWGIGNHNEALDDYPVCIFLKLSLHINHYSYETSRKIDVIQTLKGKMTLLFPSNYLLVTLRSLNNPFHL